MEAQARKKAAASDELATRSRRRDVGDGSRLLSSSRAPPAAFLAAWRNWRNQAANSSELFSSNLLWRAAETTADAAAASAAQAAVSTGHDARNLSARAFVLPGVPVPSFCLQKRASPLYASDSATI